MTQSQSGNLFPQEKRYFPRWDVNHKILYKKENTLFYKECSCTDISADGVCLSALEAFEPHQKLNLLVYLSENVAVEVNGTVLWNKISAQRCLAGFKFESISANVQDLILQFAFDCKKEQLHRNWFEGWER